MIVKKKISERPLCRYCGRALRKWSRGYDVVADLARYPGCDDKVQGPFASRAEVQLFVKTRFPGHAITVYRFQGRAIGSFSLWDGESYWAVRGFFCTNACAMDLAKMACSRMGDLAGPGYLAAMNRRKESQNANVSA